MKTGLPSSLRETLLFRPWALATPLMLNRKNRGEYYRHRFFDDAHVLYPFFDELFWDPSDEKGTGDEEEGVPCWTEPSEED